MRSSSLQSASTAASIEAGTCRSSSSSRWIEKRLSSAWSSSTIRRGSTRAIWRHSSEPIEPPAPVTSTVCAGEVGADPLELHHGPARARARPRRAPRALPGERAAALEQLEHGRQRAHRDPALAALAHDRARVEPGAEGIAMITSSGSASSRMCGRSDCGVAPHAHAVEPQAALERVVVDEADGRETELAVAHDLAQHELPAVAGADDQHACARSCVRRAARPAGGARRRARASARTPSRKTSESRKNSTMTPLGSPIVDGPVRGHALHRPQDLDADRRSAGRSRRPPARPPRSRAGPT